VGPDGPLIELAGVRGGCGRSNLRVSVIGGCCPDEVPALIKEYGWTMDDRAVGIGLAVEEG